MTDDNIQILIKTVTETSESVKSLAETVSTNHVTVDTLLKENKENDVKALSRLEEILEELEKKSDIRTGLVERHTQISNASAKFVAGCVATVLTLFFLWSQLDEDSKQVWANKALPIMGMGATGLIGYLLYGKVPEDATDTPITDSRIDIKKDE